MDHAQSLLAALAQNPADVTTWQVFADLLEEQGDPTCEFIRLSLDLTVGKVPHESADASISRYEALLPAARQEVRELLASYRCGLPVRFRVLDAFQMGENPPQEMFGYAQTVATGYLEAGTIRPGMDLGVGKRPDGQPRRLNGIEGFRLVEKNSVAAGTDPVQLGLAWIGHLKIEVGSVLTEVPPSS